MKPVQPVVVSSDEIRRILGWAQAAGAAEINRLEAELAAHYALIARDERTADDLVAHEFLSAEIARTRSARIEEITEWITRYRRTFEKLLQLSRQARDAKMESDVDEIVQAVKANRAAERKADHDRKTVGGK